jgi:hypothetical protein
MALQASGRISFYDIKEEFGLPLGKNLGAYRISQSIAGLSNLALDNEVNAGIVTAIIPQSGTIRFSDFYNKRLNIVVNCGSGSRITARSRYNNNIGIATIGGFTRRPDSSSEKKVWIHTNGTIGSEINSNGDRLRYSLSTGTWDNNTDLRLDVGSNGIITGAGGAGGAGGSSSGKSGSTGTIGINGTAALAVVHKPIIITNRGRITGGGGGGGGGGGTWTENRRRNEADVVSTFGGGGGGGGRGVPGGAGGQGGTAKDAGGGGTNNRGGSGASGDSLLGGSGGSGPGPAGNGGGGANTESSGLSGSGTSGGQRFYAGGSGGTTGYSIVVNSDSTGVNIFSGNGSVRIGEIIYNTNPT